MDGVPVIGYVTAGAASVEFRAVDEAAGLRLTLVVALLPSGLVRVRAAVTNLAEEPYALDDLTLALPVPADADELLDFAGRHNQERVPQRSAVPHRAAPAGEPPGRTGADSAYVLHAGPAGFGFAAGRVHAVHTAWSGNHVHYAERVRDRRVRARRRRAAAARRGPARPATRPTRARGSTARSATGSTRSPAASTATCGPGRGRSRPSARSR